MADAPTIFLSKLVLNPGSRDVRQGLENCHAFHQLVMRGFPTVASAAPRKEHNVLYRPELDTRTGALTVLVQSVVRPDWASLQGDGDWAAAITAATGGLVVKRIDPAYDQLTTEDRLRFRLRANPTKRLIATLPDGSPNKGGGKRVELRGEDEQRAWLVRKGEAGGFRIESVQIRPDRLGGKRQVGWRGARERGRDVVLDAVIFDGELTVVDPVLFRRTLVTGIGSGKAYGFGLLSVGPAR